MRFRVDGNTFRITMIVPEGQIHDENEFIVVKRSNGKYYSIRKYTKLEKYEARRMWNGVVAELEEYVDYVS